MVHTQWCLPCCRSCEIEKLLLCQCHPTRHMRYNHWMSLVSGQQNTFGLGHLGSGSTYDVTKYEAPYYFEVALKNGCTGATIRNGFRATWLYPFVQDWADKNKDKFYIADTLDKQKMDAKIASYLSTDAYKSLKGAYDDLSQCVTVAGPLFQETFPDLAVKLKEFITNREKHESMLKEAGTILRLPDSTKVRKIAAARTTAINEPFGQSSELNSTERTAKLEEYKVAADTKRTEKAATAAASKAQKQEKLAAGAEKKQKLQEHHEPLLAWLKQKGLCEDTCPKKFKGSSCASIRIEQRCDCKGCERRRREDI